MAAQTVEDAKQVVVDSLPATGEVSYAEFQQTLRSAGETLALRQFHPMRRAGDIGVRTALENGQLVLYVQREQYPDAEQGGGGI